MADPEAAWTAEALLRVYGARDAWHLLTSQALDHHLAGRVPEREKVQAVLGALHLLAPRTSRQDGPQRLFVAGNGSLLQASDMA